MKKWQAKLLRWFFTFIAIVLFGSLFIETDRATLLVGLLLLWVATSLAALLWISKYMGIEENLE